MYKTMLLLIAVILTAYGYAPDNGNNNQGKMLARRAAMVDLYRRTNGTAYHILSESYDGHRYTIQASL
jgi:hypothetical protein